MRRIDRIELWDANRAAAITPAGGAILSQTARPVQRRAALGEPAALLVDLLPNSAVATAVDPDGGMQIRARRLLRVVYTDAAEAWYRIVEARRALAGGDAFRVRAESLWADLDGFTPLRHHADGTADYLVTLNGRTPQQALDALLSSDLSSPALAVAGTVAGALTPPAAGLELSFDGSRSFLDGIRSLAEQIGGEVDFVWTGGAYRVDVVEEVGRSASEAAADTPSPDLRPIECPGARITLNRQSEARRFFSRVVPVLSARSGGASGGAAGGASGGADLEGAVVTAGAARWPVASAVYSAGPATTALGLSGGPVWADGVLVGAYVGTDAAGFFLVTATAAADGVTSSVTVAGDASALDGAAARFALDAAGRELTHLEDPVAVAAGGVRALRLPIADAAPYENLVAEAGISSDMSEFSGGLPVGMTAVGGAAVSEEGATEYARHGTKSARVVCAAAGDGITTGTIALAPTAREPWHSIAATLRVLSGSVRVALVGADGTEYPLERAATSSARDLRAILIQGLDVPAGDYSVRVLSAGAAEFVLDSLTLTRSAGAYEFAPTMGPRGLWYRAAEHLIRGGGIEADAYEGATFDAAAIDGGALRIDVGSWVRVRDAYRPDDLTHDVAIDARVVALAEDFDPIGGAYRKTVTLSRRLVGFRDRFVPLEKRALTVPAPPPRLLPRPSVRTEPFQEEDGGVQYGRLRAYVGDPDGLLRDVFYRVASGRGVTAADAWVGPLAVDAGGYYEASVALTAKHTSAVQFRFRYAAPYDRTADEDVVAHTFDLDTRPTLRAFALEWSAYDLANNRFELLIRYEVDEDGDALAFSARDTAGGGAYDPDAAVDGDLAGVSHGRTGVVSTGVYAGPNETLFALAKAVLAGGDASVEAYATAFTVAQATAPIPAIRVQYSADAATWHDPPFVSGDLYMRQSTDGGATWSAAIRIVGETGEDGEDGVFTDYRFICASSQPATPTDYLPAGWSDAPPTGCDLAAGNKIWVTRAVKTQGGALHSTWSTPTVLSGPQGATGPQGDPGPSVGAIHVEASLPTSDQATKEFVYLTTDEKLYRWDGSTYVLVRAKVVADDIVAATLSAIVSHLGDVTIGAAGGGYAGSLTINYEDSGDYGSVFFAAKDAGGSNVFDISIFDVGGETVYLRAIGAPLYAFNANARMKLTHGVAAALFYDAGGYVEATSDRVALGPLVDLFVTESTAATTGAATGLPALPAGYATISVNGTARKFPFYN